MTTYGIMDIGSNTIRLVIYKATAAGRFKETANIKTVARLRTHIDKEGRLSQDGLYVLIRTMNNFKDIITYHRIDTLIPVATAAIRQAINQEDVVKVIKQETGIEMRVLSGYEEAYYGYLAVINSTSISEGITIDIGGGSTEVTFFQDRQLKGYHSFPFGALTLKEQFVTGVTPDDTELRDLERFLQSQFQSIPWLNANRIPVIGIGGSARNMVQIHQGQTHYPIGGLHQYEMSLEDMEAVKTVLVTSSFEQLQQVEGLSKDRADIIIPALQVFISLVRGLGAPKFVLSRKGLRDGLFYEEIMKPFETKHFPNVTEESLFELAHDYDIDLEHVLNVTKIVAMMINQLEQLDIARFCDSEIRDLKRAASVFYLGDYIDSESTSQHTFYLLANRTIDGLSHKDRVKLALLASYKSKSTFKQYMKPFKEWFSEEEQRRLRLLGSLLKLAFSLNVTRRSTIQSIRMEKQGESLFVKVGCRHDWLAEEYQAGKQLKHLEKALKITVKMSFTIES